MLNGLQNLKKKLWFWIILMKYKIPKWYEKLWFADRFYNTFDSIA